MPLEPRAGDAGQRHAYIFPIYPQTHIETHTYDIPISLLKLSYLGCLGPQEQHTHFTTEVSYEVEGFLTSRVSWLAKTAVSGAVRAAGTGGHLSHSFKRYLCETAVDVGGLCMVDDLMV